MSECVVRMEIPMNGCSECRLKYKKRGYGGVFYCFNHLCVDKWTYGRMQNGDRPSWCPIICQLPEGHGRLIDADAMAEDVRSLWDYETVDGITASTVLKQTLTDIGNCPTIVPAEAERSEHERTDKA